MPIQSEAEEHLRVIRSLMERGTIYRAISAPVALIGGILSVLGGGFLFQHRIPVAGVYDMPEHPLFLPTWLSVLALTALANTYFLWRDARLRSDVFLSPRLRATLRALIPSCLVAAVLTFLSGADAIGLSIAWMILYGLSLLATQHFAPRSIIVLGWAFLMAGLCMALFIYFTDHEFQTDDPDAELWMLANVAMGATFGVFHLIYAACTWPRKSSADAPATDS